MTAKQLREKLALLRKERRDLFGKMTDGYKAEDLAAYEAKAKEIHDTEYALTEAERIELDDKMDEDAAKALEEGVREKITDEEKKFLASIRDAVAVGSTYTGLIPSTIASEIIKKRESYGKLRSRCRRITLSGDFTYSVDGDQVTTDASGLTSAVTATVVEHTKGPKIRIHKFKNKTGYHKRQGHRQRLTVLKVTGIK